MSFWTRMAGRARVSEDGAAATATATALVRRLRQGDASALEPLYRSESGPVYRYALALCGQPDWAADAMQDAFVKFAGRPEGWDPGRAPLGAYLAGMARHHLLARWRDRPVADDATALAEDLMHSPEEQLVQAQDHARLWEALHLLPWSFREAVVLVDLQERSYVEAAAIAGIELNTLRTRLHRGRARLLSALREETQSPAAAPEPATAAHAASSAFGSPASSRPPGSTESTDLPGSAAASGPSAQAAPPAISTSQPVPLP